MEADPELTKAFQELQSKKLETGQLVDQMDAKILGTVRAVKISELTLTELSQQGPEARVYRNLGRAFVLTSKENIEEFYQSKVKKLSENIRSYEENKAMLQRNLKESENAIRELVVRKKQQMSGDAKIV